MVRHHWSPIQDPLRLLDKLCDLNQKARRGRAVEHTMVERERQHQLHVLGKPEVRDEDDQVYLLLGAQNIDDEREFFST